VIKRGEKGVLAAGERIIQSCRVQVDAVDTIGAGDSFDAGFLHKFIRGANLEECLLFESDRSVFDPAQGGRKRPRYRASHAFLKD